MKIRMHVTPQRCIGCRTCELACAFSHPPAEGGIGKSRVAVSDVGNNVFIPLLCLQCESAACVKACPVAALTRNETTGAVDVDRERCVKCHSCLTACPFGNIHTDGLKHEIYKCDLCGGTPRCAMFCPTKTLEYLPIRDLIGAAKTK